MVAMNVVIKSDAAAVTEFACELVRERLVDRRYRVLGLPTGGTPVMLYQALIASYQRGEVDFSEVVTFNLDEYLGLEPTHPQSYRRFMEENLFSHVNVRPENIHFLKGLPENISWHCADYEREIEDAGGLDLQILGIGRDGHIGFNEPTCSLRSRTHETALTKQTIEDNRRFFEREEDVPRWALTMGVDTIMDAREILLLATGRSKADAVKAMVEGPVAAICPASVLQFHPAVTVVCDEAAAAKLDHDEFYRWMGNNNHRMLEFLEEQRRRVAGN
jgi:glucosamine-6-phosphate deaminase